MSATKLDFFEDIAVAMEHWAGVASFALTDSHAGLEWVEEQQPYRRIQLALENSGVTTEDLAKILSECLRGFSVSLLTALDGGTALAQKGRLYVVDEEDNRLGEGLHDDFVGHLFDTGRLR
ncbi:hypothetical protein [Variovorax paradoxus]|uniref:hypothetical protein n=1 Tax=Variovorax paradoxus TaxID=34073 RepID=UPI003D650195